MNVKEDDCIGLIKQCTDSAEYNNYDLNIKWVDYGQCERHKVTRCEVTRKIYLHLIAYYFESTLIVKGNAKTLMYQGRCFAKIDASVTKLISLCALILINKKYLQ